MTFLATFLDGISSQRQDASITATDKHILIKTVDKEILWRWENCQKASPFNQNKMVTIICAHDAEARLIMNQEDYQSLASQYDAVLTHSEHFTVETALFYTGILIACCIIIYSGFQLAKPSIKQMMTPEVLENMGQTALQQVNAFMPECKSKKADQALKQLIDPLIKKNHLKQNFSVHVMRSKMPNAFALPGGHIILTTGLLKHFKADQHLLQATLAHEISHVTLDHHRDALINNYAFSVLSFLVFGHHDVSAKVGNLVATVANMHYSREAELQADQQGVQYLKAIGRTEEDMIQVLLKLQSLEKSHPFMRFKPLESLSSHPETMQRIQVLQSKNTTSKKAYKPVPIAILLPKKANACL